MSAGTTTHVHARRLLAFFALAATGACSDAERIGAPASPSLGAIAGAVSPSLDHDVTLPGVALGSGARVDLVATVFVDEQGAPSCGASGTVVAVSGFVHTAASWKPLAEALFASRPSAVCRVVALDLPGHGKSGLPDAVPFGTLTLDDYVSAVLGAMEGLAARGIAARGLLAHSQGGLVAQLAQERMAAQGTSLRARHGIAAAVLIAPVPSREVTWGFAESGAAATVLQGFIVMEDAVLGPHVAIPEAAWPALFFTSAAGASSPTTPSVDAITAAGWNAPEPLYGALQLVGLPPFGQRPSVRAGAFGMARGTLLSVIGFEHDVLVPSPEARAVYAHLTGDAVGRAFRGIAGAEAVHDMHVSSPAALLAGVEAALR